MDTWPMRRFLSQIFGNFDLLVKFNTEATAEMILDPPLSA